MANCRVSRFGNYIGEEGESEEELQQGGVQRQSYAYDVESEEEEEEGAPADQQLMEIDGEDWPWFARAVFMTENTN